MVKPLEFAPGQRVGYLSVVSRAGSRGGRALWDMSCVCGAHVKLPAYKISKSISEQLEPSCGCKRREVSARKRVTHGQSKNNLYYVWKQMVRRCHSPKHPRYQLYGARGIRVCDRWRASVQAFIEDMGPTYKPGLSLDRRDNNSGYSPENCAWVTQSEQMKNTRITVPRIATPFGYFHHTELSPLVGIPTATLRARLFRGEKWPEIARPPHARIGG